MIPFSIENATALITGIGMGIARCIVKSGAEILFLGRRAEPLTTAYTQLGQQTTFAAQAIMLTVDGCAAFGF